MKLLLLSLFLISFALSKEVPQEFIQTWEYAIAPHKDDCIKHSKTNLKAIEKMFKNPFVPVGRPLKLYWTCIYQRLGLLKLDGEFDEELILKNFGYMTEKLTEECIEATKLQKDVVEKAYVAAVCTINGLGTA